MDTEYFTGKEKTNYEKFAWNLFTKLWENSKYHNELSKNIRIIAALLSPKDSDSDHLGGEYFVSSTQEGFELIQQQYTPLHYLFEHLKDVANKKETCYGTFLVHSFGANTEMNEILKDKKANDCIGRFIYGYDMKIVGRNTIIIHSIPINDLDVLRTTFYGNENPDIKCGGDNDFETAIPIV